MRCKIDLVSAQPKFGFVKLKESYDVFVMSHWDKDSDIAIGYFEEPKLNSLQDVVQINTKDVFNPNLAIAIGHPGGVESFRTKSRSKTVLL